MADQYLTPIPFLYQGDKLVRVVVGPDGEPWFVASDVCRILGLTNVSKALKGLDDDEKGITNRDTLGGSQEHLTISEAGVYTITIRARRPEAAPLRRWITHEVIPSVRRTGSYQMPGQRADKAWVDKLNVICRCV